MQRIHGCCYPYVSHKAYSLEFNGKNVQFEEISLDRMYSGAPRSYLEERCILVHANVQEHMSTCACAFCLEPYSDDAPGRWDMFCAFPMYKHMSLNDAEEGRSVFTCTECRAHACTDINDRKNVLFKYFGGCSLFWMDSYSCLNY